MTLQRPNYLIYATKYFLIHLIPQFWLPPIFLLPNMKTWLEGKRFSSKEEIIAAANKYFKEFDKNYFLKSIKKLEYRYNKCIQLKGDYVEK